MTSTEELVLQLLIDRGTLDANDVKAARQSVENQSVSGDLDAATLKYLIKEQFVTEETVAEALANEFNFKLARLEINTNL